MCLGAAAPADAAKWRLWTEGGLISLDTQHRRNRAAARLPAAAEPVALVSSMVRYKSEKNERFERAVSVRRPPGDLLRTKYANATSSFSHFSLTPGPDIFITTVLLGTTHSSLLNRSKSPMPDPIVESFAVPPLGCNCTIIGDPESKDACVVDPGGNVNEILNKLESKGLTLKRVLITHGHLDHIMGGKELKEKTNCEIIMNQHDLGLYEKVAEQCRDFGVASLVKPGESLPKPDAFVSDGDVVQWAPSYSVKCIHCPGHTPGSTSYYFEEAKLVCPGDTLFCGSVGRTSWAGIPSLQGTSDSQELLGSIRHKLFGLPDETVVVSGHGEHTSIADEKKYNPYVR